MVDEIVEVDTSTEESEESDDMDNIEVDNDVVTPDEEDEGGE